MPAGYHNPNREPKGESCQCCIPAMGHLFNEHLTCNCGVSFADHQQQRAACGLVDGLSGCAESPRSDEVG